VIINKTMTSYYVQRAAEYEQIYQKPERQVNLKTLKAKIADSFHDLDLLEIACGTGYWTQFAARSAKSIVATDYNEEVIAIARQKDYGNCSVTFQRTDAYTLDEVKGTFSAALVAFWWSHIPKAKISRFFATLHSKLCRGAYVIMLDNRYVEGSSTPISRADKKGDTYQIRTLSDGSNHEVLKNFPQREEFLQPLKSLTDYCEFSEHGYYWLGEYILK
jgi:2-polyprenyl-3-methyl-5-hydroxy-6-metoxy-1,4-benzoquinol methylase